MVATGCVQKLQGYEGTGIGYTSWLWQKIHDNFWIVTYTVGLGAVTLEGKVQGNDLEYTWRWGDDYFGQGKLSSQQQGKTLTGTWGYTKATTGGGTWQLTQQ